MNALHGHNNPLELNFNEPIDDDLEIDDFIYLDQSESDSYAYDSIFSLIN